MQDNLVTAAFTLAGAIIIYILQDWYSTYFRKPVDNYILIKGEISKCLVYYSNMYLNPIEISTFNVNETIREEHVLAMNRLRTLAAEYVAVVETIKCKSLLRWLGIIPSNDNIKKVVRSLIGLSNSLTTTVNNYDKKIESNEKRENRIKEILNLKYV